MFQPLLQQAAPMRYSPAMTGGVPLTPKSPAMAPETMPKAVPSTALAAVRGREAGGLSPVPAPALLRALKSIGMLSTIMKMPKSFPMSGGGIMPDAKAPKNAPTIPPTPKIKPRGTSRLPWR